MNVFVLSLVTSIERRKLISEALRKEKINFDFFNAIDGKNIEINLMERFNRSILKNGLEKFCNKLNKGEFGCAMSHIEIARKIVSNDYPFAIVLEDDVSFSNSFIDFMEQINLNKISDIDAEVILLGYHRALGEYDKNSNLKYFSIKNLSGEKYGIPICCYFGTYGYLITKSGALKILNTHERFDIILKADNFINFSWFHGLKLRVLEQPIIFPSEIAGQSIINMSDNIVEEKIQYKPLIVTSKGLNLLIFLIKRFLYKCGLINPIFLKNKKMMTRNFDEINSVFQIVE